ncbi:MAG: magnesium transporter [Synechococcaceae cyanobacterium SM2_3_2]|nr:magnesium transporter [Synechococcaceae cyanobacterium SM2_3_2]
MTENSSPSTTTAQQMIPRHELWQMVRDQLRALINQQDYQGAKSLLLPVQAPDIAEAIGGLPDKLQAIAFRLLSKDEAAEVFEYLDSGVQQALLEEFKSQEILELVEEMSPDDRARLFDELPANVVQRLLTQISPQERRATALLLGYKPDTAGRIMTPEYVALKEIWTVTEALDRIRVMARVSETIYTLYITDPFRHLSGILSLRDLVIANPSTLISDIMTREVVSVHTDTDQEEVARVIQRYDFLAVPVVDTEQRLVGIVTVDDVFDVVERETTEDIYTLSGVESGGDGYFQSTIFTAARKRVVWLFALLLASTFTSTIIAAQEEVLAEVVALAAFIPLLTGTGGNVGAQSSTVVIRSLSTNELQLSRAPWVITREVLTGIVLGMMLCLASALWSFVLRRDLGVSIIVGISSLLISVVATFSGTALPFLFRSFKLDPALMSAPFITTAVDVLGISIYFWVARWVLGM